MKIRKLELQGFKSFVDKTVLHFEHPVTAVVGPNGCGKSNTVDAIRWCMGEQSARHLRGKSMDDVIFNGSDSRPQHSFAEVTITFDNADGMAPAEFSAYSEIAVTRRLGRDGSSDYLINKTPVRLMDVTNLFLGTGAGTKAYSIVEQGRVGLIVTSKPEDRRALFEEAAGITRFKARKKLAERKIELTRQNLLRVSDLLAEIDKSLVSLKRQAQKAERYKALRAEQRDLDLYLASHRFLELTAVGNATRAAHAVASAQHEGVTAALLRVEAEAEGVRRALFEAESALERAQHEGFTADNEARRLEGELHRLRDALESAARRAADAERESGEIRGSHSALAAERDTLGAELEKVAGAEAEEIERLAVAEESLRDMRERLAGVEADLKHFRDGAMEAERALATAEATRTGVARRLREADDRTAKLRTELRAIERRQDEIGRQREGTQSTLDRLRDGREAMVRRKSQLEGMQEPIRLERERCEQRLSEARRDRERASARLSALREVARRHEGVGQGTRALLESRDPAVRGLLADQLAVREDLARAVAAVLAERWQDVSVRTVDDAVRLVEALRANKKGRGALVADLDAPKRPAAREHPAMEGVRGMLLGLIGGLSEVPEALWEPLAPVVLVDSLERALAAWRYSKNLMGDAGFVYVTPHGELLTGTGRVVGGVPEQAGAGLMATHAEIRALEPRVDALDTLLEEFTAAQEDVRARAQQTVKDLDAARADLHAQELALVTVERDARSHDAEVAQGKLRQDALTRELAECERVALEATREDVTLDRAIDDARARRDRAREGMMSGEMQGQAWRAEVDRAGARVTDAKVVAARARERATAARNAVHRLERSVEELTARQERLRAELERLAATRAEGGSREAGLKSELAGAVIAAQEKHAAGAVAKARYDELKTALGELDARVKSARTKKEQLGKQVASLELRAREESLAIEHLVSTIAEKHHVALHRVVGDYHQRAVPTREERQRVDELARSIERIGEVNLMAIEEHAEQEKRAVFFREQKADIERALAQLESAIAAMNKESRRRFRETFDAVNTHFQALFPRLFRGGKGMLQLTQSDDLLEAGVEIVAQPPGKKLINLEAMSGGEKTMTAVTLLFALFMHRPSPFCLLDEVEAALDEANVIRLVELVRDLTDRSQFIMITHNKRTMAMADVLYGVTMQEPGVSKVVSVKVHGRAQPGAERTQAAAG